MSKYNKILIATISLVIAVFLYRSNFALIKKIAGYNVPPQKIQPPVEFLKAPAGFRVSVFAKDLNDPRVIAFDSSGRMLVSETKEGKVVVVEDKNNDGLADSTIVLLEGLREPHGLAFYKDPGTKVQYLYVAETQQIARYVYDEKLGKIDDKNKIPQNIANLPPDGEHFTRTIAFGPNFRTVPILKGAVEKETMSKEKLYISVGSSCNVCVETDTWKRAAILESDPGGNFTAEFAGGLRNSVFFTFHPITHEMWATDMGRDYLGDELPPDEINIVRVGGPQDKYGAKKYGWPFCYGDRIKDKTFNPAKVERSDIPIDCSKTYPPIIEIPAHSAPLGLAFINSDKWPKEWQYNLLVAYHGSWNRRTPRGYKIVRFKLDKNGNLLQPPNQDGEDFIAGWLAADGSSAGSGQAKIFGRPVDLKFGPDGSTLYISDDSAGVIYRVVPHE